MSWYHTRETNDSTLAILDVWSHNITLLQAVLHDQPSVLTKQVRQFREAQIIQSVNTCRRWSSTTGRTAAMTAALALAVGTK